MNATYCPYCMKFVQTETCPYCGSDVNYPGNPMHLPVGTVLNGRQPYVIGACRGQGGFGVTYIALDPVTNTRVAVKEYFPTYCSGRNGSANIMSYYGQEDSYTKGKERFLEEAKMLQSLSDLPAVVDVMDYFETNNTAYLVMEFLDGCSLKDYVQNNSPMPVNQLLIQMKPLLADLEQMHQRGVIHRDIAPDNIILLPDGRMKLIDFGAARSYLGEKSMSVVVKKGFAPAEQYMRKGLTACADVYALAATIYYCITGKVPADSADRQYGSDGIDAPSALGIAITARQEKALEHALELQPSLRTQSVAQFMEELFGEDRAEVVAEPVVPEPEPFPETIPGPETPKPVEQVIAKEEPVTKSAVARKTEFVQTTPVESNTNPSSEPINREARQKSSETSEVEKSRKIPVAGILATLLAMFAIGALMFGGLLRPSDQPSEGTNDQISVDSATLPTQADNENKFADLGSGTYDVGITLYNENDNYIAAYRDALADLFANYPDPDVTFNIRIEDANYDMDVQMNQINEFIAQDVDIIICNLVRTSEVNEVISATADAGIPLIFVNRNPGENTITDYENVSFIGNDPTQAGYAQGQILLQQPDKGDINGDGVVKYVMVVGDPENPDAQYRTEYAIKALNDAGVTTLCLVENVGGWDQARGKEIVDKALAQYGYAVEAVFCNNDGMALGAAAAIEKHGRKVGEDIYLLGIDALNECQEMVKNGTMTGTVMNNPAKLAEKSVEVLVDMLCAVNVEHYYYVDYDIISNASSAEAVDEAKSNMQIPENAFKFYGHSYYVYNLEEIKTWEDAKAYCESLGGYLAVLGTASENEKIYNYAKSMGHPCAFFGFSDAEKEGNWQWMSQEPSSYTNWHPGQPNGGWNDNYAQFLEYYQDGTVSMRGEWSDSFFGANDIYAFICEWPAKK